MGLQDRDYMHKLHRRTPGRGRRNEIPTFFCQTPERSAAGTLLKVLLVLAVFFALYKGSESWLARRDAARAADAAMVSPPPEPRQTQSVVPAITGRPSSAFAMPAQPARPMLGSGAVMKCQGAGGTSYSDGPCPPGTRATSVILPVEVPPAGVALAPPQAAPRPAAPPPAIAPAPQVIVVQDGPNLHEQHQLECKALDAEITHLDAWARQPQSGQTQDHIRDRRKQARDRQFALHC